ncbi:MAG: phosphoribosylamine--glycine ligase [Solirubrobacterales bacterium]|nr:phosphoribosylamine--glycine ligase [Solirubrobacterales bacterium]
MKVLVVGSGGREHALVRALRRSPSAPEVLCAPGNAGIAADARLLAASSTGIDALVSLAEQEQVGLVVVGPEAPLVEGLVDRLEQRRIPAFGPSRPAARLEGSKAFAKEVMAQAGVPTAAFTLVAEVEEGMAAVRSYPVVLKDDGLAGGKGVVIAADEAQARAALGWLLRGRSGGGRVVVEEHLEGEELSLLALCDGERAVPLAPAQDYKRLLDGDGGPNTGGMGSYSPVPWVDEDDVRDLVAHVHQPVLDVLRDRGTPFHGVLYAGLMLTPDGPRVLEFNVRLGDPEAQAVLPRLRGDLVELLLAARRPGGLAGARPTWAEDWAVTVVLASGGYPEAPALGAIIHGLDDVPPDVEVTHAGTARLADGALVTAGGRVLNVTGLGRSAASARDGAYAAADRITFEGRQLRRDVAQRAIDRAPV